MGICKNAIEYQRELDRLLRNCDYKVRQKEPVIHKKFKELMEDADGMEWKTLRINWDKEISDLYHECMIPALDFIKNQPKKPIYVFKTNRKYYRLKIDWIELIYTKYPKPIPSIQLLRRKYPEWVIEYIFPNSALDFVICPNCSREFTRYNPNEKYCFYCRKSPRSQKPLINKCHVRYCQNPECDKLIPDFRRADAKYCCDACKTAACEKRKIISPSDSS